MAGSWTFRQRLSAGFAVVVLLAVVMAVISFVALRTVVDGKDRVINETSRKLIDAQAARAANARVVAEVRGFLLSGDAVYVARLAEADDEFGEALRRIRERGLVGEGARVFAALEDITGRHRAAVEGVVSLRRAGAELDAVVDEFQNRVIPERDALSRAITDFMELEESNLQAEAQSASDTASRSKAAVLAIGVVTVLLAATIALVLAGSLSRQIGSSVHNVRSSTVELQAAASQQASGTKEQTTAMSEITTTMGELLATSRQIAESAQTVAQIAADTASSAHRGDEAVTNARDAVVSITKQMETITQHMLELGKKSQQIGGIVDIINELAEQTNILAINATIEAAGAGEAGRRFAVVGDEIRKLADRVGGATKDIRALIDEIRSAVNSTVMATEAGSKTVEAGAERFLELATAFQGIGKLVTTTTEAAREIELSTKQQSSAVEQVNVAIANVAQTTKESEASSSQTLQTASQLAKLADELARLVQIQPQHRAQSHA